MQWTRDSKDIRMQKVFYPGEAKEILVSRGYISDKSGHSRGSTVDLTIVTKSAGQPAVAGGHNKIGFREESMDCREQRNIESTGQLDMGTAFDCFDKTSNTKSTQVSKKAMKNREILKGAMEKFGFINYPKEWWHFTLKNEFYKDEYFDFVVQ